MNNENGFLNIDLANLSGKLLSLKMKMNKLILFMKHVCHQKKRSHVLICS